MGVGGLNHGKGLTSANQNGLFCGRSSRNSIHLKCRSLRHRPGVADKLFTDSMRVYMYL